MKKNGFFSNESLLLALFGSGSYYNWVYILYLDIYDVSIIQKKVK